MGPCKRHAASREGLPDALWIARGKTWPERVFTP